MNDIQDHMDAELPCRERAHESNLPRNELAPFDACGSQRVAVHLTATLFHAVPM